MGGFCTLSSGINEVQFGLYTHLYVNVAFLFDHLISHLSYYISLAMHFRY